MKGQIKCQQCIQSINCLNSSVSVNTTNRFTVSFCAGIQYVAATLMAPNAQTITFMLEFKR